MARSRRARPSPGKAIGRYAYLKWLDNGDVAPCVVDVYEIEVTEAAAECKERDQRVLGRVSPDEAARRVRKLELKSLLVDFRPTLRSKQALSKNSPAPRLPISS